jgi:hypothetical protein
VEFFREFVRAVDPDIGRHDEEVLFANFDTFRTFIVDGLHHALEGAPPPAALLRATFVCVCVLSHTHMLNRVVRVWCGCGAGVVSPVEVHIKVHKAKRDLWGMCHAALTQHYALTNVRCIFCTFQERTRFVFVFHFFVTRARLVCDAVTDALVAGRTCFAQPALLHVIQSVQRFHEKLIQVRGFDGAADDSSPDPASDSGISSSPEEVDSPSVSSAESDAVPADTLTSHPVDKLFVPPHFYLFFILIIIIPFIY